jgi:hypothetical protein
VEGPYLGAGVTLDKLLPRTKLDLRAGYAFDGEYWQHLYGATYTLWAKQKLSVGLEYHDLMRTRPTIMSGSQANPTLASVTNKTDPFDYFLEKGFVATLGGKLLRRTSVSFSYTDINQYSVANSTEFSLLRDNKKHRSNPSIRDGKLRCLAVRLGFDSRRKYKYKGQERRLYTTSYLRCAIGVEVAAPNLIDNDFDFVRYWLWLRRRQRTLGLGLSTVEVYAGASDRILPPQRYFTVDFGNGLLDRNLYFKTLGETNFYGSRALMIYAFHDFGRRLFRTSGLPLVKNIPFSLYLYGGVFWTEFHGASRPAGEVSARFAERPYGELGFGLGRITPLDFRLYFTWQLTGHATNDFTVSLGTTLF